jgi:hypothetical protein
MADKDSADFDVAAGDAAECGVGTAVVGMGRPGVVARGLTEGFGERDFH